MCAAAGVVFPPVTGLERLAWVTVNVFIDVIARRMLPDVIEIVLTERLLKA